MNEKLSPVAMEIVQGLTDFRDTLRDGTPINERFKVNEVSLNLDARRIIFMETIFDYEEADTAKFFLACAYGGTTKEFEQYLKEFAKLRPESIQNLFNFAFDETFAESNYSEPNDLREELVELLEVLGISFETVAMPYPQYAIIKFHKIKDLQGFWNEVSDEFAIHAVKELLEVWVF